MQIAQKNFYKKFLGRLGEKKAEEYLRKRGYKILALNFKTHIGEIDIVAKYDGVIVFVEVKTRKNDAYGSPAEAVNRQKQQKYFKVATEYLKKNKLVDAECRFDVIEVEEDKINHIKDAFYM